VEFTYDTRKSYWSSYSWEPFAVYSTDQAKAFDLYNKYNLYSSNFPYYYFQSAEARSLVRQAIIEAGSGTNYYRRGDFVNASARYETALNLYTQALNVEKDWTKTLQELQLEQAQTELEVARMQAEAAMIEANATKTQAEAALIQANAILNQSYAWLMFGIGFIIIGIGVLVYAAKRPKTPP